MGDLSAHFSKWEFECPDRCGFNDIDRNLVDILEKIRGVLKAPIVISSGCRCKEYNDKLENSAPDSAHISGKAVDILIRNSRKRYQVVEEATKNGINRIGIDNNFVHLDIDTSKPKKALWIYG